MSGGDFMESISAGDKCPACEGSGVQLNTKTGLKVICPVCSGTGRWSPPRNEYISSWR